MPLVCIRITVPAADCGGAVPVVIFSNAATMPKLHLGLSFVKMAMGAPLPVGQVFSVP